ncbi:MAG TPA: hypothetical protein VFB45_15520 [Pseudolabrys sp.]|nr:hypothetical protein [Pseudolabrys sp.]
MPYHDLLNADGSVNAAEYDKILENRVTHEVNLRRCNEARIHAPHHVPLGCVAVFYAMMVDQMRLPELPAAEIDRIRRQQTVALNDWVGAMSVAAAKQRRAMLRVERKAS